MSGIGGFKGVSADQDARFSNKQKKLMKSMKFPKELDLKVDPGKVNWIVMTEWVAKRVTQLLGVEDDVLIQFINNKLQEKKMPEARELHIDLIPFLEKNTSLFMKELWALLASASSMASGIPQQILDEKAEELRRKKELQEKNEELRIQRKREREGARGSDEHGDHKNKRRIDGDLRGRNRWDQGREDYGRRQRDMGRSQRGHYHGGGRRFNPHRRDRSRSPYRRSPRRRSNPPPRKFGRGYARPPGSRSPRHRMRSPPEKAAEQRRMHLSRSPRQKSTSPSRKAQKYGSGGNERTFSTAHGESKHRYPVPKRSQLQGSGSDGSPLSPARKSRSLSPAQMPSRQRMPPKSRDPPIDNRRGGCRDEDSGKESEGRDTLGGGAQKVDDPKLKSAPSSDIEEARGRSPPNRSRIPREDISRSDSPRSPSPGSPAQGGQNAEHGGRQHSRPGLSSSQSPKSHSPSPRKPVRSDVRPTTSPQYKRQFDRGAGRFQSRGMDLRSEIMPRYYDEPRGGPRMSVQSWGRTYSSPDRGRYRDGPPEPAYSKGYDYTGHGRGPPAYYGGQGRAPNHGERGPASRSRGEHYGAWRGDRRGSPIRERRAEYAYRGGSPLGLRSCVEIPERGRSPGNIGNNSTLVGGFKRPRSPTGSPALKRPQESSFDGNASQDGGESSDLEGMHKHSKKKKEKKSKSKKHKKHKDGKKRKKAKSSRLVEPTSSDDVSDKVANEKRIEELRRKALQSMGKHAS